MTALVLALAAALAAMTSVHFVYRRQTIRYRGIADAETYLTQCQTNAAAAQQQFNTLSAQSQQLNSHLAGLRTQYIQYEQALGRFRSVAELEQRITADKSRVKQLATTLGKLESAAQLDALIGQKNKEVDDLSKLIGTARSTSEIAAKAKYYENYVAQLKADIEAVEETRSLQEFGFYRPRYNFATSGEYQASLDQVRTKQKQMLAAKTACTCETEWTVDGDKKEALRGFKWLARRAWGRSPCKLAA